MKTCVCEIETEKRSIKVTRLNAEELWNDYQDGDADAENALVEHYLPLVAAVMGRLMMTLPEHVDRDGLYSAGLLGLLQAIRNYDSANGTSFETYARVRIRGSMLDELRRMDWVPRTVHKKARHVQNVMLQLEQQLGATPTEEQMAKALNLSVTEYSELLDEVRPAAFVCLDSTDDDGENGNLYEVVADETGDGPLQQVSQRELKEVILARLKELPDKQRKVLALYYDEDMHLREIAEVFGLTESRICQIHAQAILSIRAYVDRFEAGTAKRSTVARNGSQLR